MFQNHCAMYMAAKAMGRRREETSASCVFVATAPGAERFTTRRRRRSA